MIDKKLEGLTLEQLEGLLKMVAGEGKVGRKKATPTTQHITHHRGCDVCGAQVSFSYTAQVLGQVDAVHERVVGCPECRRRLERMDTPSLVEVVMDLVDRLSPTSSAYVAQRKRGR